MSRDEVYGPKYSLVVIKFQNAYGKEWTEIRSTHDLGYIISDCPPDLTIVESRVCFDTATALEVKNHWERKR
jgi:hypothetical protein